MKVATWNINGLKARLNFLRLWLDDRQPDLVGLQELKMTDAVFPHEAFAELGYTAIVHGQKSWNGVAVLSRLPMRAVQVGLPGEADMGSRLLHVQVADWLDFVTLYCPNGKSLEHADYGRKLAWFESLHTYLQNHAGDHALVGGDFNIVPTPQDSFRGEAGTGNLFCTVAERRGLQNLYDLGLHDLYRTAEPDSTEFSWWDYRGGAFHRGQGLRIDFLLGTQSVGASTSAVYIDRDYRKKHNGLTASDHAPVIAELVVPEDKRI